MIVTEKNIEKNAVKVKRALKTAIIIIIAVIGVSFTALFFLQLDMPICVNIEEKPTAQDSIPTRLEGFGSIPFGAKLEKVLPRMKKDGWQQVEEYETKSPNDVPFKCIVFKKANSRFRGHEVFDIVMTFTKAGGTFQGFMVEFYFGKKNIELHKEIVNDCISISDFTVKGTEFSDQGEKISFCKNSSNDICMYAYYKRDDYYLLQFQYYDRITFY